MRLGRRQFLRIIENAETAEPDQVVQAPAPHPASILYVHPNPDGSRKGCRNCMMYVKQGGRCTIHDPTEQITPDHTCGYHVFGRPMEEWMDHPGMDPVDPRYSGLEYIPGGTSCGTCFFYEGDKTPGSQGHCLQARNPEAVDRHAIVEAMGCCAAWWQQGNPLS